MATYTNTTHGYIYKTIQHPTCAHVLSWHQHPPPNTTCVSACPQKQSFSKELKNCLFILKHYLYYLPFCAKWHPSYFTKSILVKIANHFHLEKSNDHFSVLSLLNFSSAVNIINLSSLLNTLLSWILFPFYLSALSSPLCILFLPYLSQVQDPRPFIHTKHSPKDDLTQPKGLT